MDSIPILFQVLFKVYLMQTRNLIAKDKIAILTPCKFLERHHIVSPPTPIETIPKVPILQPLFCDPPDAILFQVVFDAFIASEVILPLSLCRSSQ
jgi:hypothetical protein